MLFLALILFITGVSLLSYQILPPVKKLVDEWVKERNVRRLEKKVNGT
jgi:antibiotic biosynthesis monooxygenase (ABM) superfamily enzyme